MERRRQSGARRKGAPGGARGSRPASGRHGTAAGKGVPPWALVAIGVPVLGIFLVIGWRFYEKSQEEPEKVVVIDHQANLRELGDRATRFEKEFREIVRLDREDPTFQRRISTLQDSIEDWMGDYDLVMKPYQDENGYLKEEYRGYGELRSRVNRLMYDLGKLVNF